MDALNTGAPVRRRDLALLAGGLVLLSLLVFRQLLSPGAVLFSTDDNIGSLAMRKALLPSGFLHGWDDSVLAGFPNPFALGWTWLWLWLLPARFFCNWIHALDLVVASLGLALFLRRRGVRWPAVALGILTALWLGSNFTLTYAGHIGKFDVLVFACAALALVETAVERRSAAWALLAGGALGLMFQVQPDVALFVCLFWYPYALFALARDAGRRPADWLRVLLPMLLMHGWLAVHPLWLGFHNNVRGVASVSAEDPRTKWEFATQWSWPPEETIDFVAPGFTGWRSGEPSGPYWGRMGRSAGWSPAHPQGFPNFKLENHYLGAVPLALALAAAWFAASAWRARRTAAWTGAERTRTWDVAFWSAAALLAFLLCLGKHFPLYRLFYMLPAVSSIRNPNKFLHVVQIALGVLAAFGLDRLLAAEARRPAAGRGLPATLGALAGLFLLATLAVLAGSSQTVNRLAGAWGMMADVIVRHRVSALVHATVMLAAAAGAIHLFLRRARTERTRAGLAWALVALVLVDTLALARHYVQTMPAGLIEANEPLRLLRQEIGAQRTAMITRDGFYNSWLTYLLPYHGIPCVNYTQMPRMPEDYQRFLEASASQQIQMWRRMAVGLILSPAPVWNQVHNDAALRDWFDLLYAFNVLPDARGGLQVARSTQAQPGQHCILRLKPKADRYALKTPWTVVGDDEALRRIAASDVAPESGVLVAAETADGLPPAGPGGAAAGGEVKVTFYRPGLVKMTVSAEQPAILRIADKFDPAWRATINGRPAPLRRCDYLFQGLLVQPGLQEVTLSYDPPTATFWLAAAGLLVCAGTALGMGLRARRARPAA